jgi:hypothetical protein
MSIVKWKLILTEMLQHLLKNSNMTLSVVGLQVEDLDPKDKEERLLILSFSSLKANHPVYLKM